VDKASFKIEVLVLREVEALPPAYRSRIEPHLTKPRKILLYTDLDCVAKEHYWLITDFTKLDEKGHRIIYFQEMNIFGLAMQLEDGRNCCLGFYGSFADTVRSM